MHCFYYLGGHTPCLVVFIGVTSSVWLVHVFLFLLPPPFHSSVFLFSFLPFSFILHLCMILSLHSLSVEPHKGIGAVGWCIHSPCFMCSGPHLWCGRLGCSCCPAYGGSCLSLWWRDVTPCAWETSLAVTTTLPFPCYGVGGSDVCVCMCVCAFLGHDDY